MVYGGNKSNYDWFKGQNNKQDKKIDRKKAAKTTWKFTKIFLYFSLFFFSMWGCVQTFMVSTSPYVGQGVEITNSRDGISPSVASVHIYSESKDGENIYAVNTPQQPDNVYLSTKDADQAEILNRVEEELKHQSDNPNFSLADANKGANVVPRFVYNGKDLGYLQWMGGSDFEFSTKAVGTPVVASTAATAQQPSYGEQTIPVMHFLDENGHTFQKDITVDLNSYTLGQGEPEAWHDFNLAVAMGIIDFLEVDPEIKASLNITGDSVTDSNPAGGYTVKEYAQIHNQAVYMIANWAGYRVSLVPEVPANDGPDKVNGTADDVAAIPAHPSYSGDKDSSGKATEWNHNFIFGYGNGYRHSEYTPISTWGEAFEMSKGGGPFYGIFVYPIAWLTNELVEAMPFMQGWESFLSITIVILIMQAAAFLLSFKSTLEQAKMTELNAKKAVIEAKYAAYKGNKQMENRKKQEVAEMYKKEGVSQLGPMAGMLITMPIFLAMWRVVGSIQHFKGTEWLGMNFAASSMKELFSGEWQYLPLIMFTIATQIFSTMFPRMLTKRRDKNRINVHQKAAMKKSNKTQNIMMIVFGVMAVMFNAGLQIYMVIRSLWKIGEVLITHHIIQYRKKKARENGSSGAASNKGNWKKIFKKKEKSDEEAVEKKPFIRFPKKKSETTQAKAVIY